MDAWIESGPHLLLLLAVIAAAAAVVCHPLAVRTWVGWDGLIGLRHKHTRYKHTNTNDTNTRTHTHFAGPTTATPASSPTGSAASGACALARGVCVCVCVCVCACVCMFVCVCVCIVLPKGGAVACAVRSCCYMPPEQADACLPTTTDRAHMRKHAKRERAAGREETPLPDGRLSILSEDEEREKERNEKMIHPSRESNVSRSCDPIKRKTEMRSRREEEGDRACMRTSFLRREASPDRRCIRGSHTTERKKRKEEMV